MAKRNPGIPGPSACHKPFGCDNLRTWLDPRSPACRSRSPCCRRRPRPRALVVWASAARPEARAREPAS